MAHKALIVFNPQAGRGRGHQRAEEVHQALQAAGIDCQSVVSEDRGHAIELAHRAALSGWDLVVAAGGDGTINEVVNGLMLPKAIKGTHDGEPAVELTRSTRLVVESADPLPVHADGEILWNDARRVEISVEPGRLEVVV